MNIVFISKLFTIDTLITIRRAVLISQRSINIYKHIFHLLSQSLRLLSRGINVFTNQTVYELIDISSILIYIQLILLFCYNDKNTICALNHYDFIIKHLNINLSMYWISMSHLMHSRLRNKTCNATLQIPYIICIKFL